jgi:hypothetical protein
MTAERIAELEEFIRIVKERDARIAELEAQLAAVDDVLICNWVGPRADGNYRKALADLIQGAMTEARELAAPHPDTARLDKVEALRLQIDNIEGPAAFPEDQWHIWQDDGETVAKGRTLREAIDALEGKDG